MSSTPFIRVDVSSWAVDAFEAAGSDEKVWLRHPAHWRALFKRNVRHDSQEQGEDWPEKIAAELAALVGLPAAMVDLAGRCGSHGCVSYDVVPDLWELQPGTVLLAQLLGGHDPRDRSRKGHTLANIKTVLQPYCAPPGFPDSRLLGAYDVFAGFVAFDALISNRDRHPDNWSVLRGPDAGQLCLAPSYDHASGLGFNLTDERREKLLRDDVMLQAFLRRGTAHRFEGGRSVSLITFAHQALELAEPSARAYWLDRVSALTENDHAALIERVPGMSDRARTFAVRLISANRWRLLHD